MDVHWNWLGSNSIHLLCIAHQRCLGTHTLSGQMGQSGTEVLVLLEPILQLYLTSHTKVQHGKTNYYLSHGNTTADHWL